MADDSSGFYLSTHLSVKFIDLLEEGEGKPIKGGGGGGEGEQGRIRTVDWLQFIEPFTK